jgi:hypothetical protein
MIATDSRPPAPRRPLQNRVTPSGDLIATAARGTLMGNRGRLHEPCRRIVRRVAGGYRAWVTCRLKFRGRHRTVMAPNRYTELFFLDEATALAAGHRPCGECRRADPLLVWRCTLAPWSPAGYGAVRAAPNRERVRVLTPRSTTATIAGGYEPGVHPSLSG